MERSNLDKFLFWLTVASAIGFVLSLLFPDFTPEWLLGLSILGILVRADAMIIETRIPIYLKILIPLIIIWAPLVGFIGDIAPTESIAILQGYASFIIGPILILLHSILLIIYSKKQGTFGETKKQGLIIVAIVGIFLLIGIGLTISKN